MDANCLVGSACVRADPFTQGDAPMHFTINGEAIEVAADIRTSLLDLLRNSLGFTGTKKGCDQGACGACTILVDGERINACLALAVQYQGRDIMTVEGLARDGNLHPLQQAFIEHDGFQCGYCTPGQLCSAIGMASEIERNIPSVVTKDLAASTIDMNIEILWTDEPDPQAPMGARGIGEIGITGVGAAVANAVYNATGKRIRDLPITMDKLM
jgi:xanthine dehydrogenase YagT iron-sulfur-binding subunit